jgi:DNA-binding NtrC family response regulator
MHGSGLGMYQDSGEDTMSWEGHGTNEPSDADLAFLTFAFRSDLPASRYCRFQLSSLTRVRIGRAESAKSGVAGRALTLNHPTPGELVIGLSDPLASRAHAELARVGRYWEVVDLGSKNGVHVNAMRVPTARLSDGDVLEVGASFLVFRQQSANRADESCGTPLSLPVQSFHVGFAQRLAMLAHVAPSDTAILLHGETGSGKEVIARAIHDASHRRGAFAAVNCGAIPSNLVESELFGHKRGAFSGAMEDRPGLIRSADNGTLFLDEIAELPFPAQAALLRVLQEYEVTPIGGHRPVPVQFRVVSATHQDLSQLVVDGRFREDLLARLHGFLVPLPPLRERREDFGTIVSSLLARWGAEGITFTPLAGRALMLHLWQRNVRELEHCLKAAILLARSGVITPEHLLGIGLPNGRTAPTSSTASSPARAKVEPGHRRERLVHLLRQHNGNVSAVARVLGTTRMQVHRWSASLGIDLASFRSKTLT